MDTFSNLLYVKVSAAVVNSPPRSLTWETFRALFPRCVGVNNKQHPVCAFTDLLQLFPQSMKPELSYLAHTLVEIDKYRVETCCVIGTSVMTRLRCLSGVDILDTNPNPCSSPPAGNYYSLRSQHEKAALYFQRALKLNPRCLGAWTLMGHEYMEMRNTSAAIQAYRSGSTCRRVCLQNTPRRRGIYWGFSCCELNSDTLSKWTSVTTEPGMAWVRPTRSSRCLFTVCTITERLTSSGRANKVTSLFKKKTYSTVYQWLFIICIVSFVLIFLGPTTRACWLHSEKVMKNWPNRWKLRRYRATMSISHLIPMACIHACLRVCSELLCVCAVLLAGLLSGGRGENGSAQTGQVSDCVKATVTSNLTWAAFQYLTKASLLLLWKVTWTTERVWRCRPVLHALHPGHLLMWRK